MTDAPARRSPLPASCAARYRAVRLLGSGGHGAVWLAEQLSLERLVAIKLLHTSYRDDAGLVARFEIEARVTAALSHAHVVRVLDHGVDDGAPWIAYEHLPGRTLLALLEESGPIPWRRAAEILVQVAAAVEAAHAIGVLHRDLKTGNVMEAEPGTWKVTDFGIAKWAQPGAALTRTGEVVATPFYMAPELLHAPADERTDIYGLGLMALELVAGQLPFPGKTTNDLYEFHRNWKPAASAFQPAVPPALDDLIRRASAPAPEDRPATARELREALELVLRPAPRPSRATAPRPSAPIARPARGQARGLGLATAVLLGLLVLTRLAHREPPTPASSPSAAAVDLAGLEATVAGLERRFAKRGEVYVRIGQLERGDVSHLDLGEAERLGRAALQDEQTDLAALAAADAALDAPLLQTPAGAGALLLRARVRALAFIDWERAVYAKHDGESIRAVSGGRGDGAVELLALAARLDVPYCAPEGAVRLRVALEAGVALIAAAAPGALPRDADVGGALLLLKAAAHHAKNARWMGSGGREVERVAAQHVAALQRVEGPLARDLACLARALWVNTWDPRAASADAALAGAARESLARAQVELPRLAGLQRHLPEHHLPQRHLPERHLPEHQLPEPAR